MKKINKGMMISGIIFVLSIAGIYALNYYYSIEANQPKDFGGLGVIAESFILGIIALVSLLTTFLFLVFNKKNQEPEVLSKKYLVVKKVIFILFIVMLLFFAYNFIKFF